MIIISNGMMRSGSTLQYNIAAMVMEARGPLHRAGFIGDFAKPATLAKLMQLKRAKRWTIIKTHEAPLPRDFYDESVRVLFSYRDVRDIAASIRKKWDYPFDIILSQIDEMIEIERTFAEIGGILVQSYELLYHDIPAATRQIAAYLGVTLVDAEVNKIEGALSVDTLMDVAGKNRMLFSQLISWITRRFYDKKTLLHNDHISAAGGRDGDWTNQLSDDEIARLEVRYSSWLTARGYLVGHRSLSS